MKKRPRFTFILLSFLLACLFAGHLFYLTAHAATLRVEKYGGGDYTTRAAIDTANYYTTIQAAIDAADSGDTIKVGSGVYNENIIINKNVELLGAGAIGVGPVQPAPSKSIAYLVKDDFTTSQSYKDFLVSKGFSVNVIKLSDVPSTNLSSFDLLIVGPDTGYNYQWGTSAAIAVVKNYNGPILGLGIGGSCLFEYLQLFIRATQGALGSASSIYVVDSNKSIWSSPNPVSIPQDGIINLYNQAYDVMAIFMNIPQSGVLALGRVLTSPFFYSLIEEDGRYCLWGFPGSPAAMTATGKNVFVNIVHHLIIDNTSSSSSSDLSDTVTDNPLPDWWEIAILRPNWWNLALSTGTTILGNGLSYVVTFNKVSSGRLDGFTITNSSLNYAGIYLTESSVDISNNRITKSKDGIRAYNSSSIIRNNIIDENGNNSNSLTDCGIYCLNSALAVFNNLIINNPEAGLYVTSTASNAANIINNTIDGNEGDGIWCYQSSPTIKNNIITNNSRGIYASYNAAPAISYNDVRNNGKNYNQETGGKASAGTGDISVDPLFTDTAHGNFRLAEGSLCINAGDPNPLFNDLDGTRNDMGAYGGFGSCLGADVSEESGFIFTGIGKIPVSEIPQDSSDPSFGLARVSAENADALGIHQWVNAPFGGSLWLYGLFGEEDKVDFYQILAGKWEGDTPPDPNDFVPLNNALTKVKYAIKDGKVNYEYVLVGPKTINTESSLYSLTKDGYWSQPDLRIIWPTTVTTLSNSQVMPAWENGKYTLKYRAFQWDGTGTNLIEISPDPAKTGKLPADSWDHFTIIINNSQVKADIQIVRYDPNSPEFDPSTDGEIPECDIIHLRDSHENLRLVITASHPEGYLDYYKLDCLVGKNRFGGLFAFDSYLSAASASSILWSGVTNKEVRVTDVDTSLPEHWDHWETCAYQFRLEARSRATDGFTHLYRQEFNDHYFIDLGFTLWTDLAGDLNNDGKVTIDELTKVINAFLGKQ